MRRKTVAFITVAGSLVVAACTSDRETTAPRSITPARARATVVSTWPTCDNTALNKAAKDFFKLKSDQKLVLLFSQSPTATGALNVLKREADVRYTPDQIAGSWAAGGTVATQAAVCGGLASDALGPSDFDPASALQSGIFAVMGDEQILASVLAYNAARSLPSDPDYFNPYKGTASPIWGIEGVWPARGGSEPRYLVYGYPTGSSPAAPFQLGTIPASFDASSPFIGMTVAECIKPSASNNTQANLFHHNSANNILTLRGAGFCVDHTPSSASLFGTMSRRLAALLSPRPAFAQFAFSGTGGGDGSWGNWDIGNYTGGDITLAFTPNPGNAFTGTPVKITVTASGVTPLPPVNVRLTIVGNNGSPTGFYACTSLDPASCNTSTLVFSLDKMTSAGQATFYYEYAKAGGTDLHADGFVGGGTVQTQSVTAPQFQVQNK